MFVSQYWTMNENFVIGTKIYVFFFPSYMVRKLYAFVHNECAAENRDSIMNQEVLLPGKIYQLVLMVSSCFFLPFLLVILMLYR